MLVKGLPADQRASHAAQVLPDPHKIDLAIRGVRRHYCPIGCPYNADEETQRKHPGQFSYTRGGGNRTIAMAAAGVVCLQEFAQYDDWRIEKSMTVICDAIRSKADPERRGAPPFDAYTLYYVGQALYQTGGATWKEHYPRLRNSLVASQSRSSHDPHNDGLWRGNGRMGGRGGDMWMTAVACFILAMPNRYLPILQEGHIGSLREKFQQKQ